MADRITPNIQINFNGADITAALYNCIVSVETSHNAQDHNDTATIVLEDTPDPVTGACLPVAPKNSDVEVLFGYVEDNSLVSQGTFQVSENERTAPPYQLTVHCHTVGQDNAQHKDVGDNSYHDKSLKDIIQDLAKKSGLEGVVHPSMADIQVPHYDQTSQSHASSAAELAQRFGGAMKFGSGGKMIVSPLGASTSTTGVEVTSTVIKKSQCKSYRYLAQSRSSYDGFATMWHDADKGVTQLFSTNPGAKATLRNAEQAASEAEAKAQTAANKQTVDATASTFTFETSMGVPELQVGGKVTAEEFPPDMETGWVVMECKQRYTPSGYITNCTCWLDTGTDGSQASGSSQPMQQGGEAQDGGDGTNGDGTSGDQLTTGGGGPNAN